jgi:hypothetical protein
MNAVLSHKVTRRVDESVVLAEPQPDFTASWHPFAHGEVIGAVASAVAEAGLSVERKEYSITTGAQMFGIWEVNRGAEGFRFAIGIRNSINKSMAVGLCAGERVFVCDNMVFSSDYVLFRKHTGMLDSSEIVLMAREALAATMARWDGLAAWHSAMLERDLSIKQASILTIAAMRRDLIPAKRFGDFDRLFYGTDDEKSKYTPTLHGWHGATTELMNPLPIMCVAAKQTRLNAFIDHEVPLLLSENADKKFYSFDKVEAPADEAIAKAREEKKISASALRAEFREKVVESRREKKAAAKAARAAEAPAKKAGKAPKTAAGAPVAGERPEAGPKDRTAKQKAVDAKMRTPKKAAKKKTSERDRNLELQSYAPAFPKPTTKARRTSRVRVREVIAAEAEPVKTKVGKAPKGEVVRRRGFKKIAFLKDDEDILFCDKCAGEFKPSELNRDRLCAKCAGKKK